VVDEGSMTESEWIESQKKEPEWIMYSMNKVIREDNKQSFMSKEKKKQGFKLGEEGTPK
jgi:hypothetical protein